MINRIAAVSLACAFTLGCDEAERKRELTAATRATDSSASAVVAPPAPAPEKPRERTVIARFKKPKGLAVEGGSAYVMDALSGDKEQNEVLDLLRVPAAGGAEPVRLATKQRAAGTPLVMGGDLFFAVDGDKGRLVKVSAAAPSQAAALAVAPKAISLADPAVASDGASLFYLAPADDATLLDVMRVSPGAKASKLVSGGRSARVLFIAADKKYVYWPEAGRLMKAPIAGGAASEVAKVVYAWAAVSDGTHVYWADSPGDNMGTIRRAKIDGGVAETLASGFSYPVSLALDDKSVFFVNYDAEDGGVYRVPKVGGAAVTLIKAQKHPKRIAVDDRFVYWINVGEGALLRAAK